MQKFDAIVIGGGSGGNVGALTLQKGGKKTLLIEKHNITGGTGSSFRRGRFEFETALHQLYGITDDYKGDKGQLRKIFEELGVYDKLEFVVQHETFRLAMGDLSVAKVAEEFYDLFSCIAEDEPISKERFPNLFEYGPLPTADLLKKFFKHPLVIGAYSTYYGYLGIPVETSPFVDMALCYARGEGTCYVKGGSAMMSAAITNEFMDCGGTVKLGSAVTKILVEDGKVRGVRCDDGSEYYADMVLSNMNKVRVYVDLLDEKDVPEQVFDDLRVSVPSQSIFSVYMGLDCTPEEAGILNETSFCRRVTDPSKTMNTRYDVNLRTDYLSGVEFSCYNVDTPDASPEGTCVLSVLASKVPDWFLSCPIDEYYERKDHYLEEVLDYVYECYPGVKGHIEEIDAATPVTLMRYLGSLNGGIYGLDAYMKDYIANKLDVDSPIKGLYFCGSSVFAGGFNVSMTSGHFSAKRMLHDAGKEA